MTMWVHEALGAIFLLLLFLTVIGIIETFTRKGMLADEMARKAIHLTGGLGCLLLPFVVSSWITVLFITMIFALIFYFGENKKMLKSLSSVKRKSIGSLLFPIAILLLFILSKGQVWFYISALLVLVLADTAAALTGTRFGKTFYKTTQNERKSLEGTVMFFVVGFLAVYIPLLLLSDIPHLTIFLTALLMSLLLAGLEAVSVGGTDNLFVPLATIFLLLKVTTKPSLEITFQCISLIGIAFLIFKVNGEKKILQTRPLIIFILLTFSAWSLGSADWVIPLIAIFIIYNRICSNCISLPIDLTARELLRPLYPAILILFVANITQEFNFWFAPFIVATAVSASLCIINRFLIDPQPSRLKGIKLAVTAIIPSALPLLLCLPIQGRIILPTIPIVISLCAVTTVMYNRFAKVPVTAFTWNYAIPIITTISVMIYAGLQYIELIFVMEPSTWMEIFRCQ